MAGCGGLAARVDWCRVKSRQRALEKMMRVYGGDASRLVDLCRQSLVFEEAGGLADCLRRVAADGEVAVARVKNTMRAAHDAAASAGYRMVLVNLRLLTPEAVRLGVDVHVCELQLALREFAEVRSEEGHRRYRVFRDQRAE